METVDAAAIAEKVDPRQALAALGFEDTSEPQRVMGGWDTLLWRFRTPDGGEHALRLYILPGAQETRRRERLALDVCAAAGLPAPRPEAAGEYQGMPVMVQTWCPGTPMLSLLEKRPWQVWKLGRLFGQAQARMHAIPPPPEFVATAPDDWLVRVASGYDDVVEHARSLRPSTGSLIHLDYHPLNLIVDRGRITGVIDWAYSAAGDPRADLALTVAVLMAAPPPPGPMRPLINLMRDLVIRAWRAGYRAEAGVFPDYRPFLAWAGAMMLGEMEALVGQSHVWGTEKDVATFRRLVGVWARQAGVR